MNLEEYRQRARACRIEANRSSGEMQKVFLQTAEVWESLADRLERVQRMGAIATLEQRKTNPRHR